MIFAIVRDNLRDSIGLGARPIVCLGASDFLHCRSRFTPFSLARSFMLLDGFVPDIVPDIKQRVCDAADKLGVDASAHQIRDECRVCHPTPKLRLMAAISAARSSSPEARQRSILRMPLSTVV